MTTSPFHRATATATAAAALRLRGRASPHPARVHWPRPAFQGDAPLLVLFTDGERDPGRVLSVRVGVVVVSVPGGLDDLRDAVAAVEWVAEHGGELGGDPGRLLVGGHRAGGGPASAVALHARDEGWPPLVRQILIFPRVPLPAAPPPLAGVAPATVLTRADPRHDDGARHAARLRRAGVEVDEFRYGPIARPDNRR
ncbi:MAG: alpha/beta hydrolase [Spirillospora sp.]